MQGAPYFVITGPQRPVRAGERSEQPARTLL